MKKRMIILMLILIPALIFGIDVKDGRELAATDTTTASYVTALTIGMAGYDGLTIFIQNESATQTMYYEVWCYANNGGDVYIEYVDETSIAVSTTAEVNISNSVYSLITVRVKNNSGACVYDIEVIQHKLK